LDGILHFFYAPEGKDIIILKYFLECPATVKERHSLAILRNVYDFFAFNEPDLFVDQCRKAADSIKASPGLDDEARRQMEGELEVLRGVNAYRS
jgi:hypothetical protein